MSFITEDLTKTKKDIQRKSILALYRKEHTMRKVSRKIHLSNIIFRN
jgi:hypothetical protein